MEIEKKFFKNFITHQINIKTPIYHRYYSWGEKEYKKLWKDIKELGLDESIDSYFLGYIICEKDKESLFDLVPKITIIDGQQRLISLILLICSLCKSEEIDFKSKQLLYNNFILNNNAEKTLKLTLKEKDNKYIKGIIFYGSKRRFF